MPSTRVVDFYDHHPINEDQILDALRRRGVEPSRARPEDLFDLDQDHYGGPAAVQVLARRAGLGPGSWVLDVCAGLAGPARFLAGTVGCQVVGVDLNAGRAAAARRLTALVGLERRVKVVQGDATALPFRAAVFDACVSQEGLLHVADKAAVLAECHRVLRLGGRLAFTDWIATARLGDRERARLWEWMAATTLQTPERYRVLLGRVGFSAVAVEDLSDVWRPILTARLELYRAMAPTTIARFGERWHREYSEIYAFFVRLVEERKLGGARFTATR